MTGATGFVGPHVVAALAPSWQVRALVRDVARAARIGRTDIDVAAGTLDNPDALRRAMEGVDAVVHLAAATRAGSEAGYVRANAEGTRAVVEAALAATPRPRRLVYLSSMAAAGPSADGRPVAPGDEPRPLTAYGRSKLAGEAVCRSASGELEVVILRAPAVYGPGDRDLLTFFQLARLGVLPVPTGPERPLQLIHVQDLARAVERAVAAGAARGIYHVADARAYPWAHVARLVAAAVGRRGVQVPLPPRLLRAAAAVSETVGRWSGGVGIFNRDKARELLAPGWLCDATTAREELGFETRIPLPEGLVATAAWYRERGWLGR